VIDRRAGFGQELSRLRTAAGKSRQSLAIEAELSKGYLALLEQGRRRPSSSVVDRLAELLELSSTDRSRLRVRSTLDRLSDEMGELARADLQAIEAIADALMLFASDSEAPEGMAETLPIGSREELQLKAARHLSHVVGRAAERWRDTELLTMPDYFRAIITVMDSPDLATATAINTIDPRRWIEDQREIRYLEANARAAERGVDIRRLFIVDTSVRRDDLSRVAREHEAAGVREVRWLDSTKVSALADVPEDVVLFDRPGLRTMYVGHVDPEDVLRVEFGELVTNASEIDRFCQFFDLLFTSASQDFE